jgi:hypothetical protein
MYSSASAEASSDVRSCWRAWRYAAYQSHQSCGGAAFSNRSWCCAVSWSRSASLAISSMASRSRRSVVRRTPVPVPRASAGAGRAAAELRAVVVPRVHLCSAFFAAGQPAAVRRHPGGDVDESGHHWCRPVALPAEVDGQGGRRRRKRYQNEAPGELRRRIRGRARVVAGWRRPSRRAGVPGPRMVPPYRPGARR